jgi:hypothetical protein
MPRIDSVFFPTIVAYTDDCGLCTRSMTSGSISIEGFFDGPNVVVEMGKRPKEDICSIRGERKGLLNWSPYLLWGR